MIQFHEGSASSLYDRHFKVTRLTSEFTPLLDLCGPQRRARQAYPKQIKVTDNKDFLKDKTKKAPPCHADVAPRNLSQYSWPGRAFAWGLVANTSQVKRK